MLVCVCVGFLCVGFFCEGFCVCACMRACVRARAILFGIRCRHRMLVTVATTMFYNTAIRCMFFVFFIIIINNRLNKNRTSRL